MNTASDAFDLHNAIFAFIGATTWKKTRQILDQIPELMSEDADAVLLQLIDEAEKEDRLDDKRVLSAHRNLLQACRSEGIDAAFERFSQPPQPETLAIEIPTELEPKIQELKILNDLVMQDPSALEEKHVLVKEILQYPRIDEYPVLWAALQNDLAGILISLKTGSRGLHIKEAIECFENALTVYSEEASPVDYARTQNNLGNAYMEIPFGDRTENIHKAIHSYQEAIRFLNPAKEPTLYASAHHNIGASYAELPTGIRQENIALAISSYLEALRFWTPDTYPFDYALTLNNLGNAYWALPVENRAENLRLAINYLEEALQYRTPETAPSDYAQTQCNLGAVNADLGLIEGIKYLYQAVDSFREALRFYSSETSPIDFARTQINLGLALNALSQEEHQGARHEAKSCFIKAQVSCPIEISPIEHRRASRHLGDQYFREGHWEKAHHAYQSAQKAGELLYHISATESARLSELTQNEELVSNDAYCLARLSQYKKAIIRIEAGKARLLAENLSQDRSILEMAHEEHRLAFENARSRIRLLQAEAYEMSPQSIESDNARSFTLISAKLRTAREELESIIRKIQGYLPDFMKEEIEFKVIAHATDRLLVYMLTTVRGTMVLLVPSGIEVLNKNHVRWLNKFTTNELKELLYDKGDRKGYLSGSVFANQKVLEQSLDEAWPLLESYLMKPLRERVKSLGYKRATLITMNRLDLLPLHSFGSASIALSSTPSAFVLHSLKANAKARKKLPRCFLGIGNPLPNKKPLAFGQLEVEKISAFFAEHAQNTLYEYHATRKTIVKFLPEATYLHFSCHGLFDLDLPLRSTLSLSGGDSFTLGELLSGTIAIPAARLVVLSACQTGIVDFEHAPDESIGFPAAFHQVGVPGVVSTLWPVDSVSTALLLARFYENFLQKSLELADALKLAQSWLRTSRTDELGLIQYYEEIYINSGRKNTSAYRTMRYYQSNRDLIPFDHPFYWAGFVYSGV